jgi:hypothetical protein
MSEQKIVVREHGRQKRIDRVGDALRASSSLRSVRSLRDWLIQYSKSQDNPSLKADDPRRWLWHTDPVELRSAITQAQNRMRVARDREVLFDADGNEVEISPEVEEGEFVGLLTKLRPSLAESGKKPGRLPRWCGDAEPVLDKEPPVDGLQHPVIVELVAKAAAAGDTSFGNSTAVRDIAKMPKRKRAVVIEEKNRDYSLLIRQNAKLEQAIYDGKSKDTEILRLTHENQNLNSRVKALEGKVGIFADIDIEALARDYTNKREAATT